MVVGQQRAVRLLICNVTRLHTGMSRMDALKCSEPVRPRAKTLQYTPSLPFEEEVEIFPLYGCGKILPLARLPGQVMFGWLQSIRRWAGSRSASAPIPSRPSPWLQTSQPNMFCPGRQGKWRQSGSRPSYIMASSPYILPQLWICMVHFFVASNVER